MTVAVIELLADGIALIHAGVLVIYVAGALDVLRGRFRRRTLKSWQCSYLAIVLATSVTVLVSERCPLTRLENAVRALVDAAACYDGSFIEHYLPALPPKVDLIGSAILLTIGCGGVVQAFLTQVGRAPPLNPTRTDERRGSC